MKRLAQGQLLLKGHDFKIIPGIGVSAVVDLSSLTGDDATSSGDRTPSDSNSSKLTVHIVNVTRANSEYGNLISAEDKKRAKMWNGSGGTTALELSQIFSTFIFDELSGLN